MNDSNGHVPWTVFNEHEKQSGQRDTRISNLELRVRRNEKDDDDMRLDIKTIQRTVWKGVGVIGAVMFLLTLWSHFAK